MNFLTLRAVMVLIIVLLLAPLFQAIGVYMVMCVFLAALLVNKVLYIVLGALVAQLILYVTMVIVILLMPRLLKVAVVHVIPTIPPRPTTQSGSKETAIPIETHFLWAVVRSAAELPLTPMPSWLLPKRASLR